MTDQTKGMQMGVFPRLVALALAGLALSACAGDMRAAQLEPAAAQARCQGLAHVCSREAAVTAFLDHGVCLSLTLNRTPEYALCWPGTAPATGSPGARPGRLVLATWRDGSRPYVASSCSAGRRCICVNAGGDAPASALTFALPHPPGIHATGCLVLGSQPTRTGQSRAHFPMVTLNL